MATSTTRLGLRVPELTDTSNIVTDYSNNLDDIDANFGVILCTSSTRPATPYNGMTIRETDTHNVLHYAGGSWRHRPWSVVATLASVQGPYAGLVVLLSTDNQPYRYTGSTWATLSSTMDPTEQPAVPWANWSRTTAQTVASGTDDFADFDTAGTAHPFVTKTTATGSVFTLNTAGVYDIGAQAHWGPNSAGRRRIEIVSGSNLNVRYRSQSGSAAQAGGTTISCSVKYRFTAGATVKIMVAQNSGGPLDLVSESYGPRPRVEFSYLGP